MHGWSQRNYSQVHSLITHPKVSNYKLLGGQHISLHNADQLATTTENSTPLNDFSWCTTNHVHMSGFCETRSITSTHLKSDMELVVFNPIDEVIPFVVECNASETTLSTTLNQDR